MSASSASPRLSRKLPLTVSALAISIALGQTAAAQSSYNAPPPTVNSGTVTSNYTTPGVDVYTIGSSTAVLTFAPAGTPTAGVLNFQNAGTQVIYRGTPGLPDFTVLSRILPTDPSQPAVAFNGTVTSQIVPAGLPAVRGGSVWFYSPGGIVIGDGSVFDVGSLLLSTADPINQIGNGMNGLSLDSSASPNGVVNILSQATINATNPNSYVAVVAPTVLSRGTINVNGAAAFVAAEQATVTFNQGLFDISVSVGSDGSGSSTGFPLDLRGTIKLDNSTGAATNQRGIYAVAVPKNQAIAMVVAPDGYFGFDVASGVSITTGGIYLVAGGNLTVNNTLPIHQQIQDLPQIAGANIDIEGSSDSAQAATGGRFTAPVAARATDTIDVSNTTQPTNTFAAVSFAADTSFYGGISATLRSAGGTIPIAGDLTIFSFGTTGTGTVNVFADAGTIDVTGALNAQTSPPVSYLSTFITNVGGDVTLRSTAGGLIHAGSLFADTQGIGNSSGPGQGGNTTLTINGGTISIDGTAFVGAYGGAGPTQPADFGGLASVDITNGLLQAGSLGVYASGTSPNGLTNATGGTAQVMLHQGGRITTTSDLQIIADADGGNLVGATDSGGFGTAGTATLTIDATTGPATGVSAGGQVTISGIGRGGNGGTGTATGGAATGGTALLDLGSGATLNANSVTLTTFAIGGNSAGGNAGDAAAGQSSFISAGAATLTSLGVSADATGGTKTAGNGNGGNASSGQALIRQSDGSLTVGTPTTTGAVVSVSINAQGGAVTGGTGSGGDAFGGGAVLGLGRALISVFGSSSFSTNILSVSANGVGGAGAGTGNGGDGRAAEASALFQSDGGMQIGRATIQSVGTGGAAPGGTGGDATSSLAEFNSAPSNGANGPNMIARQLTMAADANGGNGLTGGAADASVISITIDGTQPTNVGGAALLTANGRGGAGTAGNGGMAQGGSIRAQVNGGGLAFASTFTANTDATGGSGTGTAALGGDANGGFVQLVASQGNFSIAGDTTLTASAASGSGGGGAGDATGGSIGISANAGAMTISGTTQASATAFGGVSSGNGGTATGGMISVIAETDADTGASGGSVTTGAFSADISANASQLINQGRLGGAATGGSFTALADTGAVTLGDLSVSAGAGGYGGSDPTTTTMQGGSALLEAKGANLTLNSAYISAVGQAATVFNSNPPAGPGASIGGQISIIADAGRTLTVTNGITGAADAISGRSSLTTQAGSGTGGTITVDASGSILMGGGLSLSASGTGGNVFGLSNAKAGTGQGGSIDIGVTGVLTVAQGIGATASGRGGQPLTGVGGDGIGGLARIRATQGGTVSTTSINLAADGTGTFGGNGTGGRTTVNPSGVTALGGAYLIASGGNITGSTNFTITANGMGGGTLTGNGGTGTGGQAWIVGMNGTVDLSGGTGFGTLQATGYGGGNFGTDGGAGGTGTGGQVLIGRSNVGANAGATSTSAGRILIGDTLVDATARGGSGGQGAAGVAGGVGAAGTGGTAEISADAAFGTIVANAGTTLTVAVGGTGGAGGVGGSGAAGGAGGLGQGGTAFVGTTGAAGSSSPTTGSATFAALSLDTTGEGGDGGTGTAMGAGGTGQGGTLTLASTGAPVTAGDIALVADGNGGAGGGAGRGGTTALLVTTRANGSSRGSLTQTGAIIADTTATSTGGAAIAGASTLDVLSGDATIGVYTVTSGGTTPSPTASRIDVRDGQLTAASLAVQAIGDLAIETGIGGQMTLGTAALTATRSITYGDGTPGSTAAGAIRVTGDFVATTGADYTLGASTIVGGNVAITAGGAIATGALQTTGNVTLLATAGTIGITGAVTGRNVALSSSNLQIGTGGSIGDANTQTLAFTVAGGGASFLGGTSDGSGYTLDASELTRVHATNVSFNGGPAITVRDATLSGTGAGASATIGGASGAFTLSSSGTITVSGNLLFANAGAGQSLVLNANAVRLFTDTGSIGVFGTGTTLGGRLAISANRIEAGTTQLLGSTTSFAGPLSASVTQAIGAAAATPHAEGAIQANRIELSARDDIVIQNSGTAALAAGFSAGSGGLSVTNLGGTTAAGGFNVLIYGRIQGTSGFLTNADTLGAVSFASASGSTLSGYSAQSVVNGCPIVNTGPCNPVTPVTNVIEAPPVAAIVRDVIDGNLIVFSRDTVQLPSFDQPAAIDLTFLQTPAIVTDPVASAGNPILWEGDSSLTGAEPAGPATGRKQIEDDRRKNATGGQAR